MSEILKNILKIIIGLIVIVIGAVGLLVWPLQWGLDVLVFLKGGIVIFLILVGLLILIIGITSFKS